jgi:hypothetical protein
LRYIKLKTDKIEIVVDGQAKLDDFDYKTQLRTALKAAPGGTDLEDSLKAQRCWKALEKCMPGEWYKLEDADHDFLCQAVRAYKFAIRDDVIIEYWQSVFDAPSELPVEVEAAVGASQ